MFAAGPNFQNTKAPKHSLSAADSRWSIKRNARFKLFKCQLDAVHLMKRYFGLEPLCQECIL